MKKSKVLRIRPEGAGEKIKTLFDRGGITKSIEKEEIVAIKVPFGELGDLRYVSPAIVRIIVDLVKKTGARPFLADTTTLYRHARHSFFDYMRTAAKNGFTSEGMGCPIVIADGLRGTNGQWVELDSYCKFKKVKVAQAFVEADVLIAVTHVTLHEDVGIGGAVKNVAMGCSTKETKLAMHASDIKPVYDETKCIGCFQCIRVCPSEAFRRNGKKVTYDPTKCIGCGQCMSYCPQQAITVIWEDMFALDLQRGLMDGYRGVISTFSQNKVFFVNVGFDITPNCDCVWQNDIPIVPDIGILLSRDAIACDKASWDLVKESPVYPGSRIDGKGKGPGDEKTVLVYPHIDVSQYWKLCKDSRFGNPEYELEVVS